MKLLNQNELSALSTLSDERIANGLQPVDHVKWLRDGRVGSHYFEISYLNQDVGDLTYSVTWKCRDCGLYCIRLLTQRVDQDEDERVAYKPSDSYTLPSEPGGPKFVRADLPDCKSFLVQGILSR